MKNILCKFLVLVMILSLSSVAFAGDFSIQVISGPEPEEENTVNMDDIKVGDVVEIDSYGIVEITAAKTADTFGNRRASYSTQGSGDEADFVVVWISVINTGKQSRSFAKDCEVKVVFDDDYEFAGWFGQADKQGFLLKENDYTPVEQLYKGYYMFGCTLPNFVIESKKELKMTFTLDGNEFTYFFRK